MLEDRGIPCVAIGAVRVQMEKTQPPRGLFVPFQLGRPLGEPEDVAFQRRVILQALGLLERTDGPVILEDFPDDPPGWLDTPGWTPPAVPAVTLPEDRGGWHSAFAAELAAVQPAWERARARYGRTTTGLSFVPPTEWAELAAELVAGGLPMVAGHATTALAMRFLCDDIKAMYGEAGQADGATPAARQLDAWFWRQTLAGQLLIALRTVAMASENNAMKTVGGRFLVPVPWLPAHST
jgi:hypothetical protein